MIVIQYLNLPKLNKNIIKKKVAKRKPNSVKINEYIKIAMMVKKTFSHLNPFHKFIKSFASFLMKIFLIIRITDNNPRSKLDQKKRNPGPGVEKFPIPNLVELRQTKIEIINQNIPLMMWRRSITIYLIS